MNTRLIALDLDGTLLDDQKRLPEGTGRLWRRAFPKGFT